MPLLLPKLVVPRGPKLSVDGDVEFKRGRQTRDVATTRSEVSDVTGAARLCCGIGSHKMRNIQLRLAPWQACEQSPGVAPPKEDASISWAEAAC